MKKTIRVAAVNSRNNGKPEEASPFSKSFDYGTAKSYTSRMEAEDFIAELDKICG